MIWSGIGVFYGLVHLALEWSLDTFSSVWLGERSFARGGYAQAYGDGRLGNEGQRYGCHYLRRVTLPGQQILR